MEYLLGLSGIFLVWFRIQIYYLKKKLNEFKFMHNSFVTKIISHHVKYEDDRNVIVNIIIKEEDNGIL